MTLPRAKISAPPDLGEASALDDSKETPYHQNQAIRNQLPEEKSREIRLFGLAQ
jgi:hypothetical protein